jgi:hypothetical protein
MLMIPCSGAPDPPDTTDFAHSRCSRCHACSVPSVRDTCLIATYDKILPAYRHGRHGLAEAPDSLTLSHLTNRMSPVCFDHKGHATMAEMGSGCPTCHHYSPAGEIPACGTCHLPSASGTSGCTPALETAYHDQCRNCHEDWSRDTTCAPCHRTHDKGSIGGNNDDSVEAALDARMVAKPPVEKVYTTSDTPKSFITFQHVEHIELFQLKCTDCHQHEQCRDCHGTCRTGTSIGEKEIRLTCLCCHRMDKQAISNERCVRCHDVKPHPPIFHQAVGRSLPDYLGKADCQTCHAKPQ